MRLSISMIRAGVMVWVFTAFAQVPPTLIKAASSKVSASAKTLGGMNHGITYTLTVSAAFPAASANASAKPMEDASSILVVNVECPSAFDGLGILNFPLDDDRAATDSGQINAAASTSFGIRGEGQMPTALHPRYELMIKGKRGDYGSALLIKRVQALAFVSKPYYFDGEKSPAHVIVATGFAPEKNEGAGGSWDEERFQASNFTLWRYDRAYLTSIANDPRAAPDHVHAAKAVLGRMK